MSLMRRARSEIDWPDWFPGRRLFDFPASWQDLMGEPPMKVEEYQQDDQHIVRVEMPGIDPEKDVEISLADRMLHIRAERRQQTKTDDAKGYRSEFRYGSFIRSVELPVGATEDDVKASYNDGVLEVRVPINTAEAEAKKITVSRS